MGSVAPRPAVIINYGTKYIKMGFSGNVEPCFIAPTVDAANELFLNRNRSPTNPSYPIVHGQVFNWDENTCIITAKDDTWGNYIKEHPDAESMRSTGGPIYKQLCMTTFWATCPLFIYFIYLFISLSSILK